MKAKKIQVFPVLLSRLGGDHLVADSSTLPMGCLTSYVKHYKNGALLEHLEIHPLVNRTKKDWGYFTDQAMTLKRDPSVWMFSNYIWNAEDNLVMAKAIKAILPDALIIMGGPHVPGYAEECEQFLIQHAFVDIAVRGEGEKTIARIFELICANASFVNCDYSGISGLTFRRNQECIRTADRIRSDNLDEFPSPYLSGEFNHESFDDMPGMILETNRGCPYGCTYCDWGSAILQKVRHFDLERVKKEIDYIASRRAYNLHIADANFGAFERDIEIATAVVEAKKKYGFPKKFVCSNAKNASATIGKVIKILTEGGLITQGLVAIQTVNDTVLKAVNRSNIKTKNFEKLMGIFKEENLALASELLIGLPGQTYASYKNDLQYIFDRKITTMTYLVQVMPNAPMNDPSYKEKYKIISDDNSYVISTHSFTEDDYNAMQKLFLGFQLLYMFGVLKYFLYYLQIEHNIKATDFIDALVRISGDHEKKYPLSHRINNELITKINARGEGTLELQWKTEDSQFLFNHLDEYYTEIFRFAHEEFLVSLASSEMDAIKGVQMGVMPILGKRVPVSYDLPHDFVKYFEQVKSIAIVQGFVDGFIRLKDHACGTLTVQALKPKLIDNLTLVAEPHTGLGWELRSPLRFVKPRIQKQSRVV